MPTIHDERPKLERLKSELEQGGAMEKIRGAVQLTAQSVDSQGRSWIELMPAVTEARNGPHFFTITADDLQKVADYITANPDRIPIDYDHAGAEGGSTKAAGWFTGSAEVRDGSVWAEVKWTPAAVQEIRDGSFRFVSPEWEMANKDAKTGLWTQFKELAAATLTNRPFFSEMAPVTAKAEPEQIEALTAQHGEDIAELVLANLESEPAQRVLAAYPLKDEGGNPSAADQGNTDDPKETTVADEQPVTDYMKALGLNDSHDPKHRLAAAFRDKDEKILALTAQVTELTAASTEKDSKASELASRVEELEAKDRARDIEVVLARAVEKGRVLPAEKETLAEVFAADVDGLRKMIATRPADMFAPEPKGAGGEPDRFVDDPDVAQYVKKFGTDDPVDTEQAKQHLAAMEILREQGKADNYTNDEYITAYTQAASLVY